MIQHWLAKIKKAFPTLKKENINKTNLNFNIIENIDDTLINIELSAENGICFSWQDNLNKYLLAVIETEGCKKEEIQDKLEFVFDSLFSNSSSELYAARSVIIDDMYGLEVLSGNEINDTKYDIFYGLYLSDEESGYVIIGFGDDELEIVFEKLTGASRLFSRKNNPALIYKGKSYDNEIVALRKLATKLQIDYDIDYQILNCTFYIKNAMPDMSKEISFLILSEKGIQEMDFSEIYQENKTFNNEILELLSSISAYDVSGFTVTLFKDGRYGITYYPIEEDEFEKENIYDDYGYESYYDEDNDYFPEHGNEKEYALNYITKLHTNILSALPKWDNGMVIIQNTENFTMVYPYYNIGEQSFTEINIIEDVNNDINEESYMEELGTQYGKYYPALYDYFGDRVDELNLFTVLFYFKNDGLNNIEKSSLAFIEFVFDEFCAIEDGDESIVSINLISIIEIFEQIFISKPILYITFDVSYNTKILLDGNIKALSTTGYETLNEYLPLFEDIESNIQIIFREISYIRNNKKARFTIFPNGKIGIQFI